MIFEELEEGAIAAALVGGLEDDGLGAILVSRRLSRRVGVLFLLVI
jgi:hypothetical protein